MKKTIFLLFGAALLTLNSCDRHYSHNEELYLAGEDTTILVVNTPCEPVAKTINYRDKECAMQKTVVTDFQPGEPDTTRITVPKQGKKVSRNVVSKNPTITTVRGHSEEASSDTTSTSSWFADAIKTLLGILLWLCAAILGFVAALFVLWVAYLLLRKLYWLLSSSKESYNTDPNKGRSTETKDTTDVVKADSEKTPVASVKPSSEITNSDPSTPTPHAKKGTLLKRVVIRTEETYKDE